MSAIDIPGTDLPDQPKPMWIVTRIEDTFPLSPGMPPGTRVKRVWFRIPDGTESYVDVPANQFTTDVVANMVNAHAEQLLNVLGLSRTQ